MSAAVLVAQQPAPDPAGKDAPPAASFLSTFAFPLLILLFFFVVIRPMMGRKTRDQAQAISSIKPGVKVVLASGIVGVVTKAKDGETEITIRSEDARIRVLRSSVTQVLGADEAEAKA